MLQITTTDKQVILSLTGKEPITYKKDDLRYVIGQTLLSFYDKNEKVTQENWSNGITFNGTPVTKENVISLLEDIFSTGSGGGSVDPSDMIDDDNILSNKTWSSERIGDVETLRKVVDGEWVIAYGNLKQPVTFTELLDDHICTVNGNDYIINYTDFKIAETYSTIEEEEHDEDDDYEPVDTSQLCDSVIGWSYIPNCEVAVIVGNYNYVLYSVAITDRFKVFHKSNPIPEIAEEACNIKAVTYAHINGTGRFIIIGLNGDVTEPFLSTSLDGINWTNPVFFREDDAPMGDTFKLIYHNNILHIYNEDTTQCYTTTDLVTFTRVNLGIADGLNDGWDIMVSPMNNNFILNNGDYRWNRRKLYYSVDGITDWTEMTNIPLSDVNREFIIGTWINNNNLYFAVYGASTNGSEYGRIVYTSNFINWTIIDIEIPINNIKFIGNIISQQISPDEECLNNVLVGNSDIYITHDNWATYEIIDRTPTHTYFANSYNYSKIITVQNNEAHPISIIQLQAKKNVRLIPADEELTFETDPSVNSAEVCDYMGNVIPDVYASLVGALAGGATADVEEGGLKDVSAQDPLITRSFINGYLYFDSDGNLVLPKGAKILGTAHDNTTHELIGLNEYQIDDETYDQIEIGSETIHLNLNTNNDPNAGVHVTVDTPNGKETISYQEEE
ncbi:MAG: hypothetical protein LBN74_02320 [Prevotella sp.]|jgi:hypothetical protein|nr:hypothetical protein [Prevotella sp.]